MVRRASDRVRRALTRPARWPVTWRLAAVSAALTLVILVAFAFVVGRLVSDRLSDEFRDELRSAAGELAFEIQLSNHGVGVQPDLQQVAMANGAAIRVVDSSGQVYGQTPNSADLGPPEPGVHRVGPLQVATAPIATSQLGLPAVSSSTRATMTTSRRRSTASGSSSPPACSPGRCSPLSPASSWPAARCGRSPR